MDVNFVGEYPGQAVPLDIYKGTEYVTRKGPGGEVMCTTQGDSDVCKPGGDEIAGPVLSVGSFEVPNSVIIEGVVTGEGEPLGVKNSAEFVRLEGAALGELLDSEGRVNLCSFVGMKEVNGVGEL